MNILDANNLVLRPAMDAIVTVDETPDRPTGVTATNIMTEYEDNAHVTDVGVVVPLMDLCNGGFLNNGQAQPITDEALPDNSKYGYIANELCGADGTFTNVPVVTISAAYEWDFLTITLYDSKGNYTQKVVTYPIWSGGSTAVPIETFTPNERMHIAKVSLGKAWQFSNKNLVEMMVNLRGVNQNVESGEVSLEGSEIEVKAYVGADGDRWIDIFSRMQKYAAVSFICGYSDDMCDLRNFYLSECEYDSNNKILDIKAYDATLAFLDKEFPGKYIASTYADVRGNYYNAIKQMIRDCGVSPVESGAVPAGSGASASNLFFARGSRRQIIAQACSMYTDPDEFAITYRDGGNPELIAGQVETEWEINEEDVAEFRTEIEMNVNTIESTLFTYSVSSVIEELVAQPDAVAGESYILDTSDPYYSIVNVTSDNGGAGTATFITPYVLRLDCTTSGNLNVNGYKIIQKTTAADNPRTVTDPDQRGITTVLEDRMKVVSDTQVTLHALENLLDVSNLKYKFKWRGNPHMKTQDIIRMKRVSTGNMYPEEYLYPADDLYPKGGAEIRMRITSISFDFVEGGGMISEVEARRCS